MMQQLMVDADMILEVLLHRSGFVTNLENLWDLVQTKQIQGWITELGLEKIRALVKKLESSDAADVVVSDIEAKMSICSVDSYLLQQARLLDIRDFESAVEVACATTMNIGAIVTQEPQNFAGVNLPVLCVNDLLKRQSLERSWKKPTSLILLVNDCLESQRLLDMETLPCDYLEVEDILKYRVRNSIATVLEVFNILQKAGFQGMSREELGRRADRSDSKIDNIIWDLYSFKLVICQENRVVVRKNLLGTETLEIANYLAKCLKQHIVIKKIYEKDKPNQIINRGYLQTLIKEVYPNEKYVNSKPEKYYYTEQGYFQPLLFEVSPSNKLIAAKSVGDYTSRMLGWFFFAGLLEYRSKEIIVIPIGEGKQKGKLIEETEPQQLKLFQN